MYTFNTERKDIWEETIEVRFGEIDRSDRLTLASVFNFFQETAISHAENLGVGRNSLAQTSQAWIMSRMSVQIDQRPRYRDTIKVRTWPRGGERLFAIRNYDIRDSHDISVVQGTSYWLIIDAEKRRPLRPQSLIDKLPLNDGVNTLPSGAVGLTEHQNLQKAAERKAAYSDLDYNGHVNNVSYIQWIQDALDPLLLENAVHIRCDINYLNEILSGEVVEIWSAPIDSDNAAEDSGHAFAFEGRKSGCQTAFRAELRLSGEK